MGFQSRDAVRVLFLVAAAVAGCRNEGPTPASAAAPEGGLGLRAGEAGPSPVEVARRIHESHLRRDYAGVAPLIVTERRGPTIQFLEAVDRVIDRNDALRRAAARRFGEALSDTWTIAPMRNNLGIFSAEVVFISQRFRGEAAEVALQEGENVPLVRARFVNTDTGWQLDPDPVPIHLIDELSSLSSILSEVTESIEAGGGFEDYVEAFVHRVWPEIRRFLAAEEPDSTGPGAASGFYGDALADGNRAR